MLVDWDSAVVASYNRIGEGITIFPLGYLIDKKGVIRHVYTVNEPSIETLKSQIDALLAEP